MERAASVSTADTVPQARHGSRRGISSPSSAILDSSKAQASSTMDFATAFPLIVYGLIALSCLICGVVGGTLLAAILRGQPTTDEIERATRRASRPMRTCSDCAESIYADARICRYCGN